MAIHYNSKIVTDGLVFCVDFANSKCYSGSGATVQNLITSGTNGEFIDAPTYSSNNGGYLSFVTNDGIRFPEDNALDTQTPSVSVWVRTNALSQNGFWFEKGAVNTQYSLFQEGANICWRQKPASASMVSLYVSSSGLSTTSWSNVVGTYNGVTGDRKIYLNGNVIASNNSAFTVASTDGGSSIGVYGGYSGGRAYWYNGSIGCVSVYNKELTDVEVNKNFNALRGRYGI